MVVARLEEYALTIPPAILAITSVAESTVRMSSILPDISDHSCGNVERASAIYIAKIAHHSREGLFIAPIIMSSISVFVFTAHLARRFIRILRNARPANNTIRNTAIGHKILDCSFMGFRRCRMVFRRLDLFQKIEPVLFLEFIIYQYPRAVPVLIYLAFALILSAARPVQE